MQVTADTGGRARSWLIGMFRVTHVGQCEAGVRGRGVVLGMRKDTEVENCRTVSGKLRFGKRGAQKWATRAEARELGRGQR